MPTSCRNVWLFMRDYLLIALGILSYAFGFCAFIFPEKVVIGGLAGFGTLVYFISERAFGWGIPVAVTQYVMNLALLAMAFRVVGRQFVIRTIYGATVISLFIGLLTPFFPEPLIPQQTFMNVIIGGILCGIGIGFVFVHNGSTGGTDIIAAMVSKRSNTSVGRTMMYVDFTIIASSYLLFQKVDIMVFGFIVLFLTAFITDYVINSNRQSVQFTIVSSKWREIATTINNEANRGCTVLTGMGWYTKEEVHMLMVMARNHESIHIFRIIKEIDPAAFVTQANVRGVYGNGFDQIRLKMKSDGTNTSKPTELTAELEKKNSEIADIVRHEQEELRKGKAPRP